MGDLHPYIMLLFFLNILMSINFIIQRTTIAKLQDQIEMLELKLKGRP